MTSRNRFPPRGAIRTAIGDGLELYVDVEPGRSNVFLVGEVDLANVEALAAELNRIVDAVPGNVRLNLRDVEFMGACGVVVLGSLEQRLAARGRELTITATSHIVRRLLAATRRRPGFSATLAVPDGSE